MALLIENCQVRQLKDFGISEEAARLRGDYYVRQLDCENERSKQPQRERIMEHILRHHSTDRMLRLLSMPGVYWPFERMLLDERQNRIEFTGLEWNWGTIERGIPFMPGRFQGLREFELGIGTLKYASTNMARWLWTSAGDFLTFRRNEKGGRKAVKNFVGQFKLNSCAWLDINSNLSPEVERCLTGLPSYIHIKVPVAPVAITLMVGRESDGLCDGENSIERRLPTIERLLNSRYRTFALSDAWQYTSDAGCRMLNVTGLLTRK